MKFDHVVLLLVAVFFAFLIYEREKPTPQLRYSGRIMPPLLFGDTEFTVFVWHQHPGALRNGVLTAEVNEDPQKREQYWVTVPYSFESWQPNEAQQVTFKFQLKRYDASHPFHFRLKLEANYVQPYYLEDGWKGDNWVSNLQ